MDRPELSDAIIDELGQMFIEKLMQIAPTLVLGDLDTIERTLQVAGREIMGRVVEQTIKAIGACETAVPVCPKCHQPMGLVEKDRKRDLDGLVGDYRLVRPYYACDHCEKQASAPLDERLGIGSGRLSPALARVAARLGIEESFLEDSGLLEEILSVQVGGESVRRVTEGIGAVAEAEQQAAIALAKAGKDPVPAGQVQRSEALVVQVDGAQVPLIDGYHECKVGLVATLGPGLVANEETGRAHFKLESPDYFAGFEPGEEFWWRVYVAACRRGLGSTDLKRIELLGDGSDWIWRYGRSFLEVAVGTEPIQIIEVIDIMHAREHLWTVGNVVFGSGTARAADWVEPLCEKLLEEGPDPVLVALRELHKTLPVKVKPECDGAAKKHSQVGSEGQANDRQGLKNKRQKKRDDKDKDKQKDPAEEVRKAIDYFTAHVARMDYPRFTALNLPIGSGAVESTCRTLIQEREKGAGMRWTKEGAQSVATLRAVQRSERWRRFWKTHPQRRRPLVFPGPRKAAKPDSRAADRAA